MTDLYQSSITFSSTDDDSLQATAGLTVNQVHAELRRLADSSHAQGKQFERVMVRYFLQAPLYRDKFKAVQLWGEWASALTASTGVTSALTWWPRPLMGTTGRYSANVTPTPTPCKKGTSIPSWRQPAGEWGDENITFSLAVVVSTTAKWSVHAERAIYGRTPPLHSPRPDRTQQR